MVFESSIIIKSNNNLDDLPTKHIVIPKPLVIPNTWHIINYSTMKSKYKNVKSFPFSKIINK